MAKYKKLDTVTVDKEHVIVEEILKESSVKEVYRVVSDLQEKERMILLVLYGDNLEAQNTLSLYMDDKNDYFVEMKSYSADDVKTLILLKYYEEGSLYKYVKDNDLNDKQKDSLILRILDIVCYLHQKSYIHADIKPDNFFVSNNQIRLGDFATLTKLNNIYEDKLNGIFGTKGYKYSSSNNFSIKDEIFALVSTIYYIETSEVLITKDRFVELSSKENPEEELNEEARYYINDIYRESIKDFLFNTLDLLEEGKSVDACKLKNLFLKTKPKKETTPEEAKEEIKKSNLKLYLKRALMILIPLIVAFLSFTYYPKINKFALKNSGLKCEKSYFINDNTIEVVDKNGVVKFYKYNFENKKYKELNGTSILNLIRSQTFYQNNQGYNIECKDGIVKIYK